MGSVTKLLTKAIGGSTKDIVVEKTEPVDKAVTTDEAINQASEAQRKRKRQGVLGNINTGSGGQAVTNTTGKKSLLGG